MGAAGMVHTFATDTPRSLPRLVTLEETMSRPTMIQIHTLRRSAFGNLPLYWALTVIVDMLLDIDTEDDMRRLWTAVIEEVKP